MEYEELVAMIAHIRAARDVIGLEDVEPALASVMESLLDCQNELNRHRLALLGNGLERPYTVDQLPQYFTMDKIE